MIEITVSKRWNWILGVAWLGEAKELWFGIWLIDIKLQFR